MISIECDDVMLKVLKGSALDDLLKGGIYVNGDRPLNSQKEDVVLSCISINQERPQIATTNVNIHVKDLNVKIGGAPTKVLNRERLRRLVNVATDVIENSSEDGINMTVLSENILQDAERDEHYANIRVKWYISKKDMNE